MSSYKLRFLWILEQTLLLEHSYERLPHSEVLKQILVLAGLLIRFGTVFGHRFSIERGRMNSALDFRQTRSLNSRFNEMISILFRFP